MARSLTLLAAGLLFALGTQAAGAAEEMPALETREWPQAGPFGTFDRASLQRGYQVYREVCAACHAMQYLHFRDLSGIGLSEEEIKAVAAEVTVTDGPDEYGDMFERPGKPTDAFPSPFPNEQAAKAANNGALPPDLSVIVKARKGHEDYIYSLLIGYGEPPPEMEIREGMTYNAHFPGQQIAMPEPLSADIVEFADGTEATVPQMAYDVTNFLAWAAEPRMEERKRMGVKVVLFLLLFTGLAYAVKRKVWADVH